MPDPEYVRTKNTDIPAELIEEYKLQGCNRDGWIYFNTRQGCYGLSQAGIFANNLLQSRLLAEGYYKAESTPGLWHHKWCPIQFCLIIDDFGVEYVGLEHFNHLRDVLKKFHGVQFNMAGDKFAGIDINGTMQPACVASVCPSTLRTFLSSLNIPVRPNPISCHTNACQSPTVLRPNSPQQPILQSNSTYTKNSAFKRLLDCSSTMLKWLTTSSW